MVSKKLMVVAHPDDETLFGGGQLILDDGWTVLCVTNGDNPTRRAEFEKVMYIVGAKHEIWSYPDDIDSPLGFTLEDELKKFLAQGFDQVLTHNAYGEYGHPHHVQIHQAMRRLVGESLLVFNQHSLALLPEQVWQQKVELISYYESQKVICQEHLPNTRNESITQFKNYLKAL